MLILGVDPGKRTGLALYDTAARRLLWSRNCTVPEALDVLRSGDVRGGSGDRLSSWQHVAVERMAAQGRGSSDVIRAAEAAGELYEAARAGLSDPDARSWLFRLEVCQALHVGGRAKDGQVIDRLCEMHGGDRKTAKGTKAAPGPLYGCSADSWQTLAVAIVAAQRMGAL